MALKLLEIQIDAETTFQQRPNRFLGVVDDPDKPGSLTEAHVHDPGRLEELLYPGNRVLLRRATNPNRKTRWDLIAARFNDEWILVNSGFHRRIMENLLKHLPETDLALHPLFRGIQSWKAEVKTGHSRLDFMATLADGSQLAIETKGCTLAVSCVGLFPDAPTERGARHLQTLIELKQQDIETAVIIMLFRPDALAFAPYRRRDPHFAHCFYAALSAGVIIQPLLFRFDGHSVWYLKPIPVLPRSHP